MTVPLSPAAQAVLDAYKAGGLDAALRAAVDQVVPEETWLGTEETCYAYYRQRCKTRRDFLAIADELKATND